MGKGICVNKTRVLGAMHFIYSKINLLDVALTGNLLPLSRHRVKTSFVHNLQVINYSYY